MTKGNKSVNGAKGKVGAGNGNGSSPSNLNKKKISYENSF